PTSYTVPFGFLGGLGFVAARTRKPRRQGRRTLRPETRRGTNVVAHELICRRLASESGTVTVRVPMRKRSLPLCRTCTASRLTSFGVGARTSARRAQEGR